MRRQSGFTLLEVLVASALGALVVLTVLGAYSQASRIGGHIQSSVLIQDNVRLAMDRVGRDLRMIGFGVPAGTEIGGSAVWTPVIFYASATKIGYRGEIDGGFAEVICTPKSTNANCPLTKLRLESIAYYQRYACAPPDGGGGSMRVVAMLEQSGWKSITCSATTTSDKSITVSTLPTATFTAGLSHVATVEQVYYQYVPGSAEPYGSLIRYVAYNNTPSNTFPPTGVTWTTVAHHLTDFALAYYDAAGTQLTGSTLTSTQRAAVHKVVLFMEGYDQVGPDGLPQTIQMRSEFLVRNLDS